MIKCFYIIGWKYNGLLIHVDWQYMIKLFNPNGPYTNLSNTAAAVARPGLRSFCRFNSSTRLRQTVLRAQCGSFKHTTLHCKRRFYSRLAVIKRAYRKVKIERTICLQTKIKHVHMISNLYTCNSVYYYIFILGSN